MTKLKQKNNISKAPGAIYKNVDFIKKIQSEIAIELIKPITIMEVCGTHTMSIYRYGLLNILPKEINLISGPGCPVCVTSQQNIDEAIALAQEKDVILATFGDMIRVPGSDGDLASAKANGADIRIIYSPLDAISLAEKNPNKQVVLLGLGFETTAPIMAAAVQRAKQENLKNFSFLSLHKLMPNALKALLGSKNKVDALLCPGHVAMVTGSDYFNFVDTELKMPGVIAGFDPGDIMSAILLLIRQYNAGKHETITQYSRVVKPEGNIIAQNLMQEVFEIVDAEWRGLGKIPQSALALNKNYKDFDALKRFSLNIKSKPETKGCICGEILQGLAQPEKCVHFGKTCLPEKPLGACMVSQEGTCAAHYNYKG